MTRLKMSAPAKFFFAVMATEKACHTAAEASVEERWGAIDRRSDLYSFSDYTTYYDQEMTPPSCL